MTLHTWAPSETRNKKSRPSGRLFCVFVAGVTGLEPATSGLTGQRSNQLSYTPVGGFRLRGQQTGFYRAL